MNMRYPWFILPPSHGLAKGHGDWLRRLIVGVTIGMCIGGCHRSAESNRVTLVVSGDTHGWITPCGCAANQSGGLARRATLLNQIGATSQVIAMDVGGSAIGTGEYQTVKLESLLVGTQQMGLALHNIGQSEAEFSPDELRRLSQSTGVQWVSANLKAADGKPVARPMIEIPSGGLRIAVTGIVDPTLVDNQQWIVRDGVQAVLDAFDKCDADVKIVLAYFDESGLHQLAEQLPEIDYLIGGPTGQSMSAGRVGPVTIASVTNKGKFLATIALSKDAAKGTVDGDVQLIEVKSDLPEDAAQIENLKRYHKRLEERDFTAQQAALPEAMSMRALASEFKIAGSQACAACHPQDNQIWHTSKHAHAWDVLVVKQSQFDPQCQQCHTTGYGLEGGFVSVGQSSHRTGVGCENCHGPSLAHVQDPRTRTPFPAKEQCLRCHDHENSPTFSLDAYWQKIVHGKSPPVNEAGKR